MKALDDHIEEQNKFDADGQGRECFICHASYYITAGLEDVCGCCGDCAEGAVRDALRYRWLRANPDKWSGRTWFSMSTWKTPEQIDASIDADMTPHEE